MSEIIANNKRTYDALAEQYEQKVLERYDINELVISHFVKHITTGDRVLDLGCAVGLAMSILNHKGFSVVGLDLSREMVLLAKNRNPGNKIILGNFMEVDFGEKFDAIFAQAFIHLFPKEEAISVLKKIKLSLKENGVAHITTSKSTESKEGWHIKSDYSGEHKRFRKFWAKDELTETLLEIGFHIIDYYELQDSFDKEWMIFIVRNDHKVIPPGTYQHYKGNFYEVLGEAKHSETLEDLVVYKALYDDTVSKIWARPRKMFLEMVLVNGKEVPRFKKIN